MTFDFYSSWSTEKIRMLVRSILYQKWWKIRVLWRAGLRYFMLRKHFQRHPMSPHITPWRRHLSLFHIHMSILFKEVVIEDQQQKLLLSKETSKKVIFWLNMQFVTHNYYRPDTHCFKTKNPNLWFRKRTAQDCRSIS